MSCYIISYHTILYYMILYLYVQRGLRCVAVWYVRPYGVWWCGRGHCAVVVAAMDLDPAAIL